MTKWEYCSVAVLPKIKLTDKGLINSFKPELDAKCAELGENGWEMVSRCSFDAGTKFLLTFKRQKED